MSHRAICSVASTASRWASALLFCLSALVVSVGCSSELPGPLDCEEMALQLIGRNREQLRASPAARRFVGSIVHGCLTTPFDQEALSCVARSKNLPRCMEQLAHRSPERMAALQAMLKSISP